MKLASLNLGRDGCLVVVNKALDRCATVTHIAPTLQFALDHWAETEQPLRQAWQALEANALETNALEANNLQNSRLKAEPFDPANCASPLPRAYHWADGSAYVNHVELVRRARGAEMPESFWTDPLIYQGGSDSFLGPREPIKLADERWGIDFEAEVAVVVDDVPMGVSVADALGHIKLLMLVNDVSLRNLVAGELAKGFGFYQSKPSSAFSPVAVTPDALGGAWREGRVHLPLRALLNDRLMGEPDAGVDMTFNFPQLIAHAAKTRPLCAGTIIGSGTVSNRDRSRGSCCLAEVRMLETIASGKPETDFMHFGDRVRIEMLDANGKSIFGAIEQQVEPYREGDNPC